MNTISTVVLISSWILLAGCASTVSSGPDMVPVNSAPEGARVLLDGVAVGRTPMTVAVPRNSDGLLTFELAGYERVEVDRDKVLNGWFFPGSLLWFPLWPGVPISMVVDMASHNQGKYETTPVYVELMRAGRHASAVQRSATDSL